MKKKFASYTLMLMLLNLASVSVSAQQIVPVDVSKLTAVPKVTDTVDFSAGFILELKNNSIGTKIEVNVVDEGVLKQMISGTVNSDPLKFKFSLAGQKLLVISPTNDSVTISPVDEIQIQYKFNNGTSREINIPKKIGPKNELIIKNNNNEASPLNHIPGIELHDAILAKKYYDKDDPKLYILLANIKSSDKYDTATIYELYKGNPFILDLIKGKEQLIKNLDAQLAASQGGFGSGIITKVLNTDVTTFADGLARFLVQRTKEELNVAFFQRFKDLINDSPYIDARILFPMTWETLNTIDQEIYQFENYITTLRESFERDLSLLLENLPTVIEEGKWSDSLSLPKNTNLKYSLLLTLFAAKELLDGVHPGKVLETLPDEYIDEFLKKDDITKDRNISGAFKTTQLISASLRSRDPNRYWSSLDSIQMLYKNDEKVVTARFYLGFLYEKDPGINFDSVSFKKCLIAIANKQESIMKYVLFVKDLGKKYHTIESAIAQIKLKAPETPSIDVYNRLFKTFADALEDLLEIDELPGIDINGAITETTVRYINLFREGNDLALNVVRKNYGSAVINTYNIYMNVTRSMELKPVDTTLAKKVRDFIKKYGTFMANTVKAKTSEEVAAAIEAVALPVGSASIKRQTDFNISLNAYVGLFLGSENIQGVDDGWKLNSYGVTAPIGIAVSFRNSGKSSRKSSSSSIFFSIIDLGAPVSFRFKDDKTEEVPSIQFKDIISPGVFYSFGIPRVPISVNAGWQLGPLLREVDPQYTPGETYSRISLSVVVDIPLLNFYTKNK